MLYKDYYTKGVFSGGYVLPEDFDQEDRTDWMSRQNRQTSQSDQEEFGQVEPSFAELRFE